MEIDEAAKQLRALCEPCAPGDWSIGVAEPDTLYLYKHKRGARVPVEFAKKRRRHSWMGYTVIVSYVGPLVMG